MATGFQLNLSNSYKTVANREQVTLKDALNGTVCTVQDAKRLGGNDTEKAPSRGKYLEWRASWRLPQPNVTGSILPGWTITDSNNNVWVVLSITYPGLQDHCWQCTTNRLLFNAQLDDTVQYEQATCSGASADGSRTITFTAVGSPITAAIEPESQDYGMMFGTLDTSETFLVYLNSDPSGTGPGVIKAGDLLTDQNAVKYEILRVFERDRLDLKPCMRCIKKL